MCRCRVFVRTAASLSAARVFTSAPEELRCSRSKERRSRRPRTVSPDPGRWQACRFRHIGEHGLPHRPAGLPRLRRRAFRRFRYRLHGRCVRHRLPREAPLRRRLRSRQQTAPELTEANPNNIKRSDPGRFGASDCTGLVHYCLAGERGLRERILGFVAWQPKVDARQSEPRYETRIGRALCGASQRHPIQGLSASPTGTSPHR